jgi:uncharacterized protein (DUF302 family)
LPRPIASAPAVPIFVLECVLTPAGLARPAASQKRAKTMTYYFTKTVKAPFAEAIDRVTAALKQRGFGVLTTIDVKATMKAKLDVDFRPYTILGACNPSFAYKALTAENKIGTMLPCNVVVQEVGPGEVEVAAVDPIASMRGVENVELASIAGDVREQLRQAVESL